MLIPRAIVAVIGVGALGWRPHSALSALLLAVAAGVDVAFGARVAPALAVAVPLVAFLTAALSLAALVERSGLAERTAAQLAMRARGSSLALYAAVCALCAGLTAAVSLDGAVVLMVPLVLVLARRHAAPLAPLLFGVIAVANGASIAVPQGNPTNLVLIDRLGISAGAFAAHMLGPGLLAAALCAIVVALTERRALAVAYRPTRAERTPFSASERHAALSLAAAALVAWTAPLLALAPWWPFAAAVAVALGTRRERLRLIIPWRVAVQIAGLLIVIGALGMRMPARIAPGLGGLLIIAMGIGAVSALIAVALGAFAAPSRRWPTTFLSAVWRAPCSRRVRPLMRPRSGSRSARSPRLRGRSPRSSQPNWRAPTRRRCPGAGSHRWPARPWRSRRWSSGRRCKVADTPQGAGTEDGSGTARADGARPQAHRIAAA